MPMYEVLMSYEVSQFVTWLIEGEDEADALANLDEGDVTDFESKTYDSKVESIVEVFNV